MKTRHCCVCRVELPETSSRIGNRHYCELHFRRVLAERKGVWFALFGGVLGSLVYVGLCFAIDAAFPELMSGSPYAVRFAVALALALLPASFWLLIFTRFEALEPEPKDLLLEMFALGALVQTAIGKPIMDAILAFADPVLASGTLLEGFLVQFLAVGVFAEYAKYLCLRTTVFQSRRFDERTDGIVYGAAVGLGWAFASNLGFALGSGAFVIGELGLGMAVETLAQACFAGLAGWFLACAKFEDKPFWWTSLGLLSAAAASGLLRMSVKAVSRSGLGYTPLRGYLVSGLIALAVFGLLFALVRSSVRKALAIAVPAGTKVPAVETSSTAAQATTGKEG